MPVSHGYRSVLGIHYYCHSLSINRSSNGIKSTWILTIVYILLTTYYLRHYDPFNVPTVV